jgi:hypothetical protein
MVVAMLCGVACGFSAGCLAAEATAPTSAATQRIRPPRRPGLRERNATRLQRLASLRTCGAKCRYRHPWLATRDIDWDRALVEAIPRVNAARDAAAYADAVQGMLAAVEGSGDARRRRRVRPSHPRRRAPAPWCAPNRAAWSSRISRAWCSPSSRPARSRRWPSNWNPYSRLSRQRRRRPCSCWMRAQRGPPEQDGASSWLLTMLVEQLSPRARVAGRPALSPVQRLPVADRQRRFGWLRVGA